MLGKRYYRKKSLRLKEEEGVITEEEKEEMEDMKVLKMDKLKRLISVKMEGLSYVSENTGYCCSGSLTRHRFDKMNKDMKRD